MRTLSAWLVHLRRVGDDPNELQHLSVGLFVLWNIRKNRVRSGIFRRGELELMLPVRR